MNAENNTRVIFRPTIEQYKRLMNLYQKSGRYKHLSELLRHIMEIGLDEIEGVIEDGMENKYK